MSKESAISVIERGELSELCHVLEESEWDIRSEPLDSEGQSAQHIACTSGHLDIVQYLVIERNCSVTLANINGHTPLLLSLIHKHWKIADFLLQYTALDEQLYGITRSFVSEMAKEALHESCEKGYVELLSFINARLQFNPKGEIPIEKARLRGALHHVKYLIKERKCTIPDDMPDIHVACIVGDVEKVKLALDSNGQSILATTDHYGMAALHYAACELSVLHMIVGVVRKDGHNNCMLNLKDKRGNSVLHYCIISGCTESVKQVIGVPECNVNQLNVKGDAPLHVACELKNIAAVELLVENERCDPNIHNRKGNTALHIAASIESNGIENLMVKCLLRSGKCDLNQVNSEHQTTLHVACKYGHFGMVEMLIANGADIQAVDENGNTACHSAGHNLKFNCLRLLLKYVNHANGDAIFHIVCGKKISKEKLPEFVKFLKELDIYKFNKKGETLLHIACKWSSGDVVGALVAMECDVNACDGLGNTALHIAVCSGRETLQKVQCLLESDKCNPNVRNKHGHTPLHDACRRGNIEVLEMLVTDQRCDVNIQDDNGNTPLQTAILTQSGKRNVQMLLGSKRCNPNHTNEDGDTALHIVCRMRIGNELEYLKLLLSVPGINPDIANHAGHTLVEVAGTNYAIIDALKKIPMPKQSSIQAYLKLFVVGNSGAGKSTLIKAVTTEASQLLKYSPFSRMKYVNPRDVPPHTAGIVPIPFNSKHFGNAVLYDFAGQHEYYSSHAAVMENLILPSPPLFLLLVDISKPMEEIKEELHYWWHFIDNQAQKATAPPHVLLGGSHMDIVKQRGRHQLDTIRMEIETCVRDIKVSFTFAGLFPLDCRRLASQGLTKLLTQLQTSCNVLREAVDINLHCHILKAFLTTPVFQDEVYCKVSDIVDQIETSDSYLPQSSLALIPLLQTLNDQGHILLLENYTDEDQCWVILKPEVLLTDINGSIFAPEYFQKRSIHFAMSTGVGTLSKLKESFKKYNHEVIVEYLIHHEFCFRIKDQHTLDMIINNQVPRTLAEQFTDEQQQEKYYFFPALVSVENPQHICQKKENITFECGWFYVCGQETEQLTTRFLHVLILRLAFACEPTDNPTEAESVVLLRRCSVWKHGIAWLNNHDIETIVEVGLQCRWVAVMMRCPDNEKVQCAVLRSKVIKTVLKTRKDFCPAITMKEYLIHPSNLQHPFEGRKLTLYSMREIAKVIVEGDNSMVMDTMGKDLISVPKLLPFEPYLGNDFLIEKFFVGDTSLALKPDDITQLEIQCCNMLMELKKAFKQDIKAFRKDCAGAECTEVESCKTLFHILHRRGFKTWKHFENGFSRFSIFCGKNPMVRMVWQV